MKIVPLVFLRFSGLVVFQLFYSTLLIPAWIIYWIIGKIPWKPGRLGSIMPLNSVYFVYFEKFNEDQIQLNVICDFKVQGSVDIENFRQCVQQRIAEPAGNGRLRYPEALQHPTKWLGHYFWEWDSDFKIEDHVIEMRHSLHGKKDIHTIRQKVLDLQFTKDKSPWQIYIVHDNNKAPDSYCHVILKSSHILMDASSMFRFLLASVSPQSQEFQPPLHQPPPAPLRKRVQWFICFPLSALMEYWKIYSVQCEYPKLLQSKQDSTSARIAYWRHWTSKHIPFEQFRTAAKLHNVCCSSFIMAGVSGGIHKYLLAQEVMIPAKFVATVPLAPRSSSDELMNAFSLGYTELPISVNSSSDRVEFCERAFQHSKNSPFLTLSSVMFLMIASLTDHYAKVMFAEFPVRPLLLTIFPGPSEMLYFNGLEISDITFLAHGLGHSWVIVSTYNKELKISGVFPSAYQPSIEVRQFVNEIDTEFRRLCLVS